MNIEHDLKLLMQYLADQNYKGYDPYDGLNSPLTKALAFNSKIPRIVIIQLLRRLPVNIRPLIGIRPGYNPKGLGLFLWSFVKLYQGDRKPEHLEMIDFFIEMLERCVCTGYSGNSWGYNFDWQSRAFFIPKNTPTIVNSSFIGHALLDAYGATGNLKALEMAVSIKDFIMKDLHRKEEGGAFCFSYTPIDRSAVHNANLLGASLLLRLSTLLNEEALRETALSSLAYTMKYQRADGSWFYGEAGYHHWIDSFHTGFNLQAIKYFLDAGYAQEWKGAFDSGLAFYRDNFFLEDGTPKYYHDSVYPIDIHAPAQALAFFSQLGAEYKPLTDKVAGWMIKNLQDKKGYFYFRKTAYGTNRIPYIRWGQAWAFHALTSYWLSDKEY